MRVKDAVGRFGEELAVVALEAAGLTVLERNWRCHAGEIDVVARDGDVLVVVEVKTRSSGGFGSPAEAVTVPKRLRLRRLAVLWMEAHREGAWWSAVRFDVVSVVRLAAGGPRISHVRAAF